MRCTHASNILSATAVGINSSVASCATRKPHNLYGHGAFTTYNESILFSMSHINSIVNSIFSIYHQIIPLSKNR